VRRIATIGRLPSLPVPLFIWPYLFGSDIPRPLRMSKLPITYDRLGKKRAQQAHFKAHAADSDDDPIDSLSSPTRPIHQQSGAKSKSEDRPRRDQKPLKIPRSERPTLPDHKKPHLSPSLIRSNSVQQSSELGPSDVAPNAVQDAHPSKRKHADSFSMGGYDEGKAGPATQALKRRKVYTACKLHRFVRRLWLTFKLNL